MRSRFLATAIGALLLLSSNVLFAQQFISGIVRDTTGQAISGVQVLVTNTTVSTLTDADGAYSLRLPYYAKTITFSHAAFQTQELNLGLSNKLDLVLLPMAASTPVPELPILPGLSVPMHRGTGSFGLQLSDDWQSSSYSHLSHQFTSGTGGLQLLSTGASPGAPVLSANRGFSSLNNARLPLLVVDGVRMDGLNAQAYLGNADWNTYSSWSDLPVEAAQSIVFLPGGAATALYGAAGTDGVLYISTQAATLGVHAPHFQYTASVGSFTAPKRWMHFSDSRDDIYNRGFSHHHRFSAKGSTTALAYFFTGSFLQQEGYQVQTDQKKYNFHTGVQANVSAKLKYSGSVAYTDVDAHPGYSANHFFNAPAMAAAGFWGDLNDSTVVAPNWHTLTDFQVNIKRWHTAHALTWQPFPHWTLQIGAGLDARTSFAQDYRSDTLLIALGQIPANAYNRGWLLQHEREARNINANAAVRHAWRKEGFSLLSNIGAEWVSAGDDQVRLHGFNLREGSRVLSTASELGVANSRLLQKTVGLFLYENLEVSDAFHFDAGYRQDFYTTADNNRQTSASARLGFKYWPLPNTSTSKANPSLAIFGNWGLTHSIPNGFYRASNQYLQGEQLVAVTQVDMEANSQLAPEKTATMEGGLIAGLLEGSVQLQVSYYNRNTTDAVAFLPLIASSGQQVQPQNAGTLKNSGVEASATIKLLSSADWKANLSLGYTNNKGQWQLSDTTGQALPLAGSLSFYTTQLDDGQYPGHVYAAAPQLDEQGIISSIAYDQDLGQWLPNAFGNMLLDLSYKRFSCYAQADYQIGGHALDVEGLIRYAKGLDESVLLFDERYNAYEDLAGQWVNSTDFLRLRRIGVVYHVPVRHTLIEYLEVGLHGRNIALFTNAPFDPESMVFLQNMQGLPLFSGLASGANPLAKEWLLEARMRF